MRNVRKKINLSGTGNSRNMTSSGLNFFTKYCNFKSHEHSKKNDIPVILRTPNLLSVRLLNIVLNPVIALRKNCKNTRDSVQ